MKTIGIIGGMSWESTALYYRAINEGVKHRLGGLHSAKIALESVDFHEIEHLQAAGNWDEAGATLARCGLNLKAAGADFLLIATNTMHRVAHAVEQASDLPLLHIADATAARIKAQGLNCIGLLGTAYTMEQDFYRGRLVEHHGLDVIIPDEPDRKVVHQVIYDELCQGIIRDQSRTAYQQIIQKLKNQSAEAIILGCTEIGMLIGPEDTDLPLLDTTAIHAEAAVDFALSN